MLNDALSHGLWEATAPPGPPTAPLRGDVRADVAVIGCGYTGLSAALHLAEAGAKTIALEAAEIGFGAAGRNVGLVNAGMWVMPAEIPKALGPDYGERLMTLLDGGPAAVWALVEKHAIACEAEPAGTLKCAVGKAGLGEIEERAQQLAARGQPVRVLDAAQTAARLGGGAYAGALFDARAGTIQPLAYVRGLAHAAVRAGAVLHTGSAVRSAARTEGCWRLATDAGSVTAEKVIVATDAYGGAPFPEGRREQILLPYFNFATRPLTANLRATILPGREGCWDTRTIMNSFRLDRSGRLVFGSVGALRGTGLAVHRAFAMRALKKLYPQLGPVAFEHAWWGWIGMTGDALPRFHRLADNLVSFSGYNGRGIGTGTVFGRVLADHVLGRITEKDLPLPVTAPERPAWPALREAYYEAGAQVAHAFGERV